MTRENSLIPLDQPTEQDTIPNPGPNKATGSSTTQVTGYSRRTDGRARIGGALPNRSTSARECQAQRGQARQLLPHQIFTGSCRYFRPYFHH